MTRRFAGIRPRIPRTPQGHDPLVSDEAGIRVIGDVRVDDTALLVFYNRRFYGEEERAASSFADRQIIGALKVQVNGEAVDKLRR